MSYIDRGKAPRYIDANKLNTRERGNNSQRTMWREIQRIVDNAPTEDVAPIKHGKWLPIEDDVIFECSECGTQISTSWDYDTEDMWNYCPHCSAKMDLESGEGR